ncbi:MAG TPA: di-heme-cytochrome C peroxidase [Vicinamibacterales bacterium]|nr:di-heme-cytochrome C peroxidase [Vicinamibacterales bacterium]
MKRHSVLAIVAAVIVVLVAVGAAYVRQKFTVTVPTYPAAGRTVWLDQNWTREERDWFHHVDQGTQTFRIPYEWFIALEQPVPSLAAQGLLSETAYLDRYGFIPDDSRSARAELPIGFGHGGQMRDAAGAIWINPRTNQPLSRVGLTCAACHTGRFTFNGTAVLIDGGPALANVFKLQTAVGLSLFLTKYVPFRFDRFAGRVLGPDAADSAKAALRDQLDQVLIKENDAQKLEEAANPTGFEEGFARLDALNRIGNAVFALDLGRHENYRGPTSPVHFPRIWSASWFSWVQYNGSIEQPMVRNAGEALGVMAWLNVTGGQTPLFSSSVQLKALFELEALLAGKQPDAEHGFSGLRSPKWPNEVLPKIDTDLAARGEALYTERCQGCHLPAVTKAEFWSSERWLPPNAAGERYLDVELIDVTHVGTDPGQAQDMRNRRVALPDSLGLKTSEFGPALGRLVELTVNRWYDDQQPPTPAGVRDEMNGHRANGIQAPLKYKVRPLNGVWATPPYLHNGSVPTVYALLSPADERPKVFYLGDREYDPKNLGYRGMEIPGGFTFDTSLPGNHNTGHEFNDTPGSNASNANNAKSGVIGRKLSPEERYAIIEYLKTQ